MTRQDWEDYLIRLYFGAGKSGKDDFLCLSINRAYRDFNRTLHGIDKCPTKENLYSRATNYLKSIFSVLKLEDSKPKTQEEFDRWHKQTCLKLKDIYANNDFEEFSIGQAQKWVNMTFKYIFCIGENRLEGYSDVYKYCHVPIDNIILEKVIKLGVPRFGCPWSRLNDYDKYITFQKWFRGKQDLPLDAEFKLWMSDAESP